MSIKFAVQKTAETSYLINKEVASFQEIFEQYLAAPRISEEKDGSTIIPSFFRATKRVTANVIATSMIFFDVDQTPEHDMVSLEEVEDALIDLNLEHAVYTSYSNTAECPRFRIVIPFTKPAYPEEYLSVASALLEQLDEFLDGRLLKVIDGCWRETARCYFTYTVHPERRNGAISFYNPGHPADTDELKLHLSTYGQNVEYNKTQKTRASGTAVGAQGRSMELNRILGGMFRSSTEDQIVQRLMEVDQAQNSGNNYFRDLTYSRNKPRAGESQEQASWRACRSFVKSHINWLRRKIKAIDETVVVKRADSSEPMPTHDALIKLKSVKDQKTKKGGDSALLEFQVMTGEHAGRHFWHRMYGEGNHPTAIKISQQMINNLATSSQLPIASLKDVIKAQGKIIRARIKLNPGTQGFKPQNEVGAFL